MTPPKDLTIQTSEMSISDRAEEATEEQQNETPPKQKQPIDLLTRNLKKGKGGLVRLCKGKNELWEAATVTDIQEIATNHLNKNFWDQRRSDNDNFILEEENILVLQRVKDHDGEMIFVQLKDGADLDFSKGDKFVALECFTTVPVPLLRTVLNWQVEPVVPNRPDADGNQSSPLFCAGMKGEEQTTPWHGCKSGSLQIHGISLFMVDDTSSIDPEPFVLGDNELTGTSYMPIENYKALPGNDALPQNLKKDHLGFLATTLSYETSGAAKNSLQTRRKSKEHPTAATKKTTFFRFVLPKGSDLGSYKFALVFDNSTENHWSLIRTSYDVHELPDDREWLAHHKLKVVLPLELHNEFYRLKIARSDDDLKTFLKEKVFLPSQEEPECMIRPFPEPMLVFPKVAALFRIHSLKMVASAEPKRPEVFRDEGHEAVYSASLALFHVDPSESVGLAIESLGDVEYKVDSLDSTSRMVLLGALKEVYTHDIQAIASEIEMDHDVAWNALATLGELLEKREEEESIYGSDDTPIPSNPSSDTESSEAETQGMVSNTSAAGAFPVRNT